MDEITRFDNLKSEYKEKQGKAESPNASEEEIKAAKECCHRFKLRCQHDINQIPEKLADPGRADEQAALKQVYKEASEYLPTLEQKCPGDGVDPPIEPPAKRILL